MQAEATASEQRAVLALLLCPGLSHKKIRSLLLHFGSAREALAQGLELFPGIDGWGKKSARSALESWPAASERAELQIEKLAQIGARVIVQSDPEYPDRLKQCPDAPLLLYSIGPVSLNPKRSVAIVGSRSATKYGLKITRQLVEELSGSGAQVVSGLAHGIDGQAHRSALDVGLETVGVLGTGLDLIYPVSHQSLAARMSREGGLLSEYPIGTSGDPSHFPMRNRIVAGLAEVTVVVEAGERSGALITARMANDYGREVLAVPGSWDRPNTRGCNELIRKNAALILTEPSEILKVMSWGGNALEGAADQQADRLAPHAIDLEALEPEIRGLAQALILAGGALDADALSEFLGLTAASASALFFTSEMNGWTKTEPGKMIRWVGRS